MGITFDTLAYVKHPRIAGISEEQAEAHAEALIKAIEDQVATKSDITEIKREIAAAESRLELKIAELRTELAELRGEVNGKIEGLRGEVNSKIEELRGEVNSKIEELGGRISALEAKVNFIQIMTAGTFTGIVALVIKAFWPH